MIAAMALTTCYTENEHKREERTQKKNKPNHNIGLRNTGIVGLDGMT